MDLRWFLLNELPLLASRTITKQHVYLIEEGLVYIKLE